MPTIIGNEQYLTSEEAADYLAKKWGKEYSYAAFRQLRHRWKLQPDFLIERGGKGERNTVLWKTSSLDKIEKPDRSEHAGSRKARVARVEQIQPATKDQEARTQPSPRQPVKRTQPVPSPSSPALPSSLRQPVYQIFLKHEPGSHPALPEGFAYVEQDLCPSHLVSVQPGKIEAARQRVEQLKAIPGVLSIWILDRAGNALPRDSWQKQGGRWVRND